MFILHIDRGAGMRGGQWQALYLMEGLQAAGHRVRLLGRAGAPLLDEALKRGLDARPLRLAGLPGEAAEADMIHAHDARAHALAALLNKPAVVARRVAFPVRTGAASRWKYRRAAHYIAVSRYVREVLIEAGIEPARITVVYDGVPAGPPPRIEDREGVVAMDSDDPGKGKAIVERAANLAGIPVRFSQQLDRDLREAAIFVYITDLEGLGSAALLAMASGAAVIASRVGGLPEIVEHEVSGLLTSNDPAEVAPAIQRLAGDRALAARLAREGRTRMEREFTVERMVRETLEVYERVLH